MDGDGLWGGFGKECGVDGYPGDSLKVVSSGSQGYMRGSGVGEAGNFNQHMFLTRVCKFKKYLFVFLYLFVLYFL